MRGIQMDAFEDLLPEDPPPAPVPEPVPTPAAAAEAPALLDELKAWSEAGWIRRLEAAFARFLAELEPGTPDLVLLSAAMAVHMEGRGHTCLVVAELVEQSDTLLGWLPAASGALKAVLGRLPSQPEAWLQALRDSRLVFSHGVPAFHNEPLVLADGRLYLRRYWDYEQRVAAQVAARTALAQAVEPGRVRHWLDRLFAGPAGARGVDWQKIACAVALRGRLSIITGGPGTGKTYTAARLLALLFAVDPAPARLRVALAAPTGKAAARLKQAIDKALQELAPQLGDELPLAALASHMGAARTLHSLLGARPDTRRFAHDALHPLEIDVLIVDEASMIHLEMMAALLEALPPAARVVLLGDKDQLASVEAGAVLGDLCRDAEAGHYRDGTRDYVESVTGQALPAHYLSSGSALAQQTVMLRESRRFGGPIGQLAQAINQGDAQAAARLLQADGGDPALHVMTAPSLAAVVQLAVSGRAGAEGGYGSYLELLHEGPGQGGAAAHEAWVHRVLSAFERFRLLCAVREGDWGVAGLNAAIERGLADAGLLSRRGEWYEGRPIMVTRNDYGVGVFNGDIGIALRSPTGGPLRACFLEGHSVRSVAVSRLSDVETAFAMTVHKSQGSEFEHTVLVLPDEASRVLTRELVYTGVTRARQAFTLVAGRDRALPEALAEKTRRSSGLLEALRAGQGG